MRKFKRESGFTLVELAIVMVVIALLVTIVAAGKNIIAAGKVRAVLMEVDSIQSGFVRFQEKYSDLPGDMVDASSYWPMGTCGNPCDGNGNEQLFWNGAAGAGAYHEGAQALHHLQLADMIGGDPALGHTGNAQLGVNMLSSKIANAGWAVDWNNIIANTNALQLGGEGAGAPNDGAVLHAKDAFAIDDKLDDGLASSGRVRAPTGGKCAPATTYDLSVPNKTCILRFQLDSAL